MWKKFISSRNWGLWVGSLVFVALVAWLVSIVPRWMEGDQRPLRFGLVGSVVSLDPADLYEAGNLTMGVNLYDGLVRYNPDTLKVEPNLAKSWQVSPDGRVYQFELRRGVQFHSGREVTAADVKYSWERILAPATQADSASLLLPIQGAKDVAEGKARQANGIAILDDYDLQVILEQPDVSFVTRLGQPPFFIVDRNVTEKEGRDYGTPKGSVVGTGPFILKEWTGDQVVLERNPQYFGGRVGLSGVHFLLLKSAADGPAMFKEGKLDVLDQLPLDQMKKVFADQTLSKQLVRQPLLSAYYLGFNVQYAPFNNLRFRQAVAYAINRAAIVDEVLAGTGTPLYGLTPGIFNESKQAPRYPYDPELAAQLLVEAGYPEGKGLPLITYTYNDGAGHEAIAKVLKQQLAQVGIQVRLRAVAWDKYQATLANGECQFFRNGWLADYPDPDNLYYNNFHSYGIGVSNFSLYRNPQVDSQLEGIRRETKADRMAAYSQVEQSILEEAPAVGLFSWDALKLVSRDVRGLQVTGLNTVPLGKVKLR